MDARKQPTTSQLFVELASNPSTALCGEHVALLLDAAQQFFLSLHSSDTPHSDFATLINVMLDRFFSITRVSIYEDEDPAQTDSFLDCLLYLTDQDWRRERVVHAHALTLRFIFVLLQGLVGNTGYQAHDLPGRTSAFICAFIGALSEAGEQEKEVRSTPEAAYTVNVDRSGFMEHLQDNDLVRICTTIQQTCRTERLVADPEVFRGQMRPVISRRSA